MDGTIPARMDFAQIDPGVASEAIAAAAIATLDWAALAKVKPAPKAFVIPGFAPAGEVTLFTGAGSAGKSLLAQQLATALAAGVQTLRLDLGQAPAIYLTCEDDEGQLHWRQAHICEALGVPMASLAGKLHIASLRGALDNALGSAGPDGEFVLSPAYHRLAAMIRRTGVKLVALDNVAHLFAGNENDRGDVTRFANALNRLAGETGAAIILLGHPNKIGDSYSGSTAWLNAVRSQIVIEHDLQSDMRTLTVGKANYARKGELLRFAWIDWAFVHQDDLSAAFRAEMAAATRQANEDQAFLDCLRIRTTQGEGRLVGPSTGPNYAPTQFEKMAEAKKLNRIALARAMERLFAAGQIETYTYRNKAKGRDVTIIREVSQ